MKKYLLLIDTSTEICSVALSDGTELLGERSIVGNRHSEKLALFIHDLLELLPGDATLDGVAVTEGPGSYTGLRIGASYVKALCWAKNIPLIVINTLQLMSETLKATHPNIPETAILMPMIDARRMEVYATLYPKNSMTPLVDIKPMILTDLAQQKELLDLVGEKDKLIFFGSGSEKAKTLFEGLFEKKAEWIKGVLPHAQYLDRLARQYLEAGKEVDIAYWEPFYLKEYEAKKSHNKVLGK